MASLSSLLGKLTESNTVETNLEQGQIFAYTPGTQSSPPHLGHKHWFNECGTAEIEVWGASGSGSMMCCCGIGLPGNPAAYVKKVVRVNSDSYLCFMPGFSCGNASALCYRGCSNASCMTLCTLNASSNNACSCICAQGGMSGQHYCMESCSPMCKYMGCNNCATQIGGSGCGIICNYGSTYNHLAAAYSENAAATSVGTDLVCPGGFSCLTFLNCNMCCLCYAESHVQTSAGIFGPKAQVFSHRYQPNGAMPGDNNGFDNYMRAIAGITKNPTSGAPYQECYNSSSYCGCYEYNGCAVRVPPGIPGYGGATCSGIRDMGGRGGHGGIKIKFNPN